MKYQVEVTIPGTVLTKLGGLESEGCSAHIYLHELMSDESVHLDMLVLVDASSTWHATSSIT